MVADMGVEVMDKARGTLIHMEGMDMDKVHMKGTVDKVGTVDMEGMVDKVKGVVAEAVVVDMGAGGMVLGKEGRRYNP